MLIWRISDGRIGHERYHETLDGFIQARYTAITQAIPPEERDASVDHEAVGRSDGQGMDIRFYRVSPSMRHPVYPGYYASQVEVRP